MSTSENIDSHIVVIAGSDRSFGVVFTVFFVIIGLLPLVGNGVVRWWSLGLALLFLVISLTMPKLLAPLNRLWFRLGLLLHSVTSPVIMGVIFFGVLTPIALLMRALGKNPLSLKYSLEARSYWIVRDPPGPSSQSMKKQF